MNSRQTGRVLVGISLLLLLMVAGCATQQEVTSWSTEENDDTSPNRRALTVSQDWGNTIYWVLPGRRVLESDVFGTVQNPRFTLDAALDKAPEEPAYIRSLLRDVPTLVAVPENQRARVPSDTGLLRHTEPSPYSNRATPLGFSRQQNGYFRASIVDLVRQDRGEGLYKTGDEVDFESVFHDPQGNRYRVELNRLAELPLPGYKTSNGAFLDRVLHGSTGTGSPLLPELYAHAGFWGMADITVNGKQRGIRLIHFMTTQVVRDRDYDLVHGHELPLGPNRRHFPEQPHHSHLMVHPVKPTSGSGESGFTSVFSEETPGLKYAPVPTVFETRDDARQEFIYVMFEQDRLESVQGVELRFTSDAPSSG